MRCKPDFAFAGTRQAAKPELMQTKGRGGNRKNSTIALSPVALLRGRAMQIRRDVGVVRGMCRNGSGQVL